MANRNYLEVEPKANVFARLVDSDTKAYDLEKDELADIKTATSVPDFNVLKHVPVVDVFKTVPDFKILRSVPGICGKAKTDKDAKIFINLCHCSEVPPPPPSFDMKKMIYYSSEKFLHEIPLIIGECHEELDKGGGECKCYDFLINSAFYEALTHLKGTDVDYLQFFFANAYYALKIRYDITVLNETIKHLNKSYHGTMPLHVLILGSTSSDKVAEKDDIVKHLRNSFDLDSSSSMNVCISERFDINHLVLKAIFPKAGNCSKCKSKEGENIFINLCHSSAVPLPQLSLDWDMLATMGNEARLALIPISIGEPHLEKDEENCECKCYDVVINTVFYFELADSVSDKNLNFVMLLAFSALQLRYNINILMETIEKKGEYYQGTMPLHFIKLDTKTKFVDAVDDKVAQQKTDEVFVTDKNSFSSTNSSNFPKGKQNLKIITPEVGKCAKVKTYKNEVIYLNLCHSPEIPPPLPILNWDNLVLMSFKDCVNEIPMSLGKGHIEVDEKSYSCICYDIVINSGFYHELSGCISKHDKLQFILLLSCFLLKSKYDVNLDTSTTEYISKDYQGSMTLHPIHLVSDPELDQDIFKKSLPVDEDVLMTKIDSSFNMNSSLNDISPSLLKTSELIAVTPKAGKCAMLKTDKNKKVFINLCHCPEAPEPSFSHDWKKLKLTEIENCLWKYPMSLAEPHIEEHEMDSECMCFDVVINSKFYYELTGSVSDEKLNFIMLLACSAVKAKWNIPIDITSIKRLSVPYLGTSMALHALNFLSKPTSKTICLDSIVPKDDDFVATDDSPPSAANISLFKSAQVKVTPKAGNCVMGKTDKNEKIFINLCHCPEIPPPYSSLDWNMLRIMSPEDCLNEIPMSLGDPHIENDIEKDKCKCYDTVINSEFYYELSGSVNYTNFQFIMLLACSALELKYGFSFDYDSLENLLMPYKGSVIVLHTIKLISNRKSNVIPNEKIDPLYDNFMSLSSPVTSLHPAEPSCNYLFDPPACIKAITPRAGLCVKAKSGSNEKVFINLCHHSDVPPPPPSMNVEDIIACSEESLFHFPLSVGELHVEKDKTGNKCKCFDAVINSKYYQDVHKKTSLRDFILILAASHIERKYDIAIDVGTFRILNKPYHGNMPQHFIKLQTKERSNFEDFVPKEEIIMPVKDSSLIPFQSPKILDYNLFQKPSSGRASLLICQSFTTGVLDRKDLCVFISKHKLTIDDTKGKNLLSIPLPYSVLPEKCLANLWNDRLTVAMPVAASDL